MRDIELHLYYQSTKYRLCVFAAPKTIHEMASFHGTQNFNLPVHGRLFFRTDHSDGSYSAGNYPWSFHDGEIVCSVHALDFLPVVRDYFCRYLKMKAFW
jgi:hypothetical protein